MIIVLKPNLLEHSIECQEILKTLKLYPEIDVSMHRTQRLTQECIELYLFGEIEPVLETSLESLPGIQRIVQITKPLRRLDPMLNKSKGFEYEGILFHQNTFTVAPGLCAVDSPWSVKKTFEALQTHGIQCARMGAFKPRTSPYSFQGLGANCLPYVFELAGKYGIKVVIMEITHDSQIELIHNTLSSLGDPTGVMLQIGTRNAQNFELLKEVGKQLTYPLLVKRGFGNTLEESIQSLEYIAKGGNTKIIFCLRGVKTHLSSPHRNLVDFGQIPIVKRLLSTPICVDPSHAVGHRETTNDGLMDLYHVSAQGVIAGANLVLVDFHPNPKIAKVDGKQALSLDELPWYLEDLSIARDAYLKRFQLAKKRLNTTQELTEMAEI